MPIAQWGEAEITAPLCISRGMSPHSLLVLRVTPDLSQRLRKNETEVMLLVRNLIQTKHFSYVKTVTFSYFKPPESLNRKGSEAGAGLRAPSSPACPAGGRHVSLFFSYREHCGGSPLLKVLWSNQPPPYQGKTDM